MADVPASDPPSDSEEHSDRLAADLDREEAGVIAAYDGAPFWLKVGIFIVVTLAVAILLGIWHDASFHWFEHHTGIDTGSGPWYSFWSGFGSDLGEATIFTTAIAIWRHHSCHVRGCVRVGRQLPGTPYLACPRHNPDHKGHKRSVDIEELLRAHKEAKRQTTAPAPPASAD